MRARQPDVEGYIQYDGVKVGYEVSVTARPHCCSCQPGRSCTVGSGSCRCRTWPAIRVITFDRPGNGRSDRSTDPDAYGVEAVASQALAVMDATGTDRAVLVSLSQGAAGVTEAGSGSLRAGARRRAHRAAALGLEPRPCRARAATERFFEPYPAEPQRWEQLNAQYWKEHYEDFAAFFFLSASASRTRPSSTRTACGWAAETTPEVLLADVPQSSARRRRMTGRSACRSPRLSSMATTTASAR